VGNFTLAIICVVLGFFFWPLWIVAVILVVASLLGDLEKMTAHFKSSAEKMNAERAHRQYLESVKECTSCFTLIDNRATRCPNCTAAQPAVPQTPQDIGIILPTEKKAPSNPKYAPKPLTKDEIALAEDIKNSDKITLIVIAVVTVVGLIALIALT